MENIDRFALPTDDSCMEGMPDRMSERMPEDMPDKVPECLPDRMPERRRLSQAGASTLKKSKQGIGVSLLVVSNKYIQLGTNPKEKAVWQD